MYWIYLYWGTLNIYKKYKELAGEFFLLTRINNLPEINKEHHKFQD